MSHFRQSSVGDICRGGVRVRSSPSLIMIQKDMMCCAPQPLARLEKKVSVIRSDTSRSYRSPVWAPGEWADAGAHITQERHRGWTEPPTRTLRLVACPFSVLERAPR
eukprot:5830693-Pyramimonas_sp.AAC.1